ncbi:MAG TPA: glycosyltransferase family 4 protein [Gaiellaceae bacterium]|nr:glycosyltransferase family 4 protein [Gaiellaceae bacterium]
MHLRTAPRAAFVHARAGWRELRRVTATEVARLVSRRGRADLAVFHEFAPPPSGGGNQFLAGLVQELRRRGLEIEVNRISGSTPVCLFNSFNFDDRRLRRFARAGCRMVHRVDGPIGVYRGFDDGTDRHIAELNDAYADATVLQSRYSLEKHRELGLELRDPVVIPNAPDPAVFTADGRASLRPGDVVRLITTSWSDNQRKGADVIAELERRLDPARYSLTFVGRSPVAFERARVIPPVASQEVARLLREHHVFVFASLNEACSNALLEALACGLPALYVDSGSNGEVVGEAGLPFRDVDEAAVRLEELVGRWDELQGAIRVPSLTETADRYLEVLRP